MASSGSLSQESLDHDDLDLSSRRSRAVRVARGRTVPPVYTRMESLETTDDNGTAATAPLPMRRNGAEATGGNLLLSSAAVVGSICDHDSPTRIKIRDKQQRCWPPSHATVAIHKGKQAAVKDKRKLREKRRSSGLVHIQSTESTGDSMDENDKELDIPRSSAHSEIIDADNPQTPEEDRKGYVSRTIRNKSPSDLDADLEDNQDYDSTVSQSEANSSRTPSATALQTIVSPTPKANTRLDQLAEGTDNQPSELVDREQCVELQQLLMKEREENLRLQELLRNKDQTISVLEKKISELVQHKDM